MELPFRVALVFVQSLVRQNVGEITLDHVADCAPQLLAGRHVSALGQLGLGFRAFHFAPTHPGKLHAIGIASKTERAVIATTDHPWSLAELAATLPAGLDVIIVEGYKSEGAPKVEVHRGDGPLLTGLEGLIAVVTDAPRADSDVPQFGHDDIAPLCDFLLERLRN